MQRRVEPEWLDELAPDDPRARRSRGDLRRINRLMGNAGIVAQALLGAPVPRGPGRLVEIGAGDGTFLLGVVRKISRRWHGFAVQLVDKSGIVSHDTRAQFRSLGCECACIEADVFEWLRQGGAQPGDWIVANLFLHHFSDEKLRELLSLIAPRASLFAACETRRSWWPWLLGHFLGLMGCNAVTRRDAVLSVRAGFCRQELSRLWPQTPGIRMTEGKAGWASHRFVVQRDHSNPEHHG